MSTTISFANNQQKWESKEDGERVASAIKKHQYFETLILSGNTLSTEAAKPIAEILEEHQELKRALWSDLFTGRLKTEIPKTLKCLCDSLQRAGALLTELDLSDNAIGPMGFPGIEKFIASESAFNLQVLKLNNCGLGSAGITLANCLKECKQKSREYGTEFTLKVFIAGRNRLENAGAIALASAFEELGSLQEIVMPQNGINKEGIVALAKAFKSNRKLNVINLNDNTFGNVGAKAMAEAVGELQQIEMVDFGDCLCRRRGSIEICRALKNSNSNIVELNLSGNEIDTDAAKQIITICTELKNLSKLSMNTNCFGENFDAISDYATGYDFIDLGSESDDQGSIDSEDEEPEEEIEIKNPSLEAKFVMSFFYEKAKLLGIEPDPKKVVQELQGVYGQEVNEPTTSYWFGKFQKTKSFDERKAIIVEHEKAASDT
uniref:Uncharacterized protein n=1 Tax=Acrobeloides nanus TaxID=290746 RepID=A0A914EBE3_9BILA